MGTIEWKKVVKSEVTVKPQLDSANGVTIRVALIDHSNSENFNAYIIKSPTEHRAQNRTVLALLFNFQRWAWPDLPFPLASYLRILFLRERSRNIGWADTHRWFCTWIEFGRTVSISFNCLLDSSHSVLIVLADLSSGTATYSISAGPAVPSQVLSLVLSVTFGCWGGIVTLVPCLL